MPMHVKNELHALLHPEKDFLDHLCCCCKYDWEGDGHNSKHRLTPKYCYHRLKKDLVKQTYYGMPQTTGYFWNNFWEYLKNENTVLSIFLQHRLHPFAKFRFIYLFSAMCFLLFIQATYTLIYYQESDTDPHKPSFEITMQVILATTYTVLGYKYVMRFMLECTCIYYNAYNETHDENSQVDIDGRKSMDEGIIEHSGREDKTWFQAMRAGGGFLGAGMLGVGVLFLILGLSFIYKQQKDGDLPRDYTELWLANQGFSLLITEPMTEWAFGAFYYYWAFKKHFKHKWSFYFDYAHGEELPVNLSKVARKAKAIYIKEKGYREFINHYPYFDRDFKIVGLEIYPLLASDHGIASNSTEYIDRRRGTICAADLEGGMAGAGLGLDKGDGTVPFWILDTDEGRDTYSGTFPRLSTGKINMDDSDDENDSQFEGDNPMHSEKVPMPVVAGEIEMSTKLSFGMTIERLPSNKQSKVKFMRRVLIAIAAEDVTSLQEYIKRAHEDLRDPSIFNKYRTDTSENLLHLSYAMSTSVIIDMLVHAGVDTEGLNAYNQTPMLLFAKLGKLLLVKFMVEKARANLYHKDDMGKDARQLAKEGGYDSIARYIQRRMDEKESGKSEKK